MFITNASIQHVLHKGRHKKRTQEQKTDEYIWITFAPVDTICTLRR